MAEQPHTCLRSPRAMPKVVWSGVKLAVIGLWSSGNSFSRVICIYYGSPLAVAKAAATLLGVQQN
jgi:hypothetical protein